LHVVILTRKYGYCSKKKLDASPHRRGVFRDLVNFVLGERPEDKKALLLSVHIFLPSQHKYINTRSALSVVKCILVSPMRLAPSYLWAGQGKKKKES